MTGKKKLLLFILVATVILFLLILLVLFILLFTSFYRQKQSPKPFTQYKYSEFDFKTNETTRGIVTLPKTTFSSPDDYLSYETTDGKNVLISPIESTEYICRGTCSCEEEQEERRFPWRYFTISTILILAATSPTVMVWKAKKDFLQLCRTRLKDTCRDDSVKFFIESCEENSSPLYGSGQHEVWDETEERSKKIYKLLCQGTCRPREGKELTYMFRRKAEEFGCDKLQYHTHLHIEQTVSKIYFLVKEVMLINDAKLLFKTEHLNAFCEESSMPSLSSDYSENEDGSMMSGISGEESFCIGTPVLTKEEIKLKGKEYEDPTYCIFV